MSLLRRDQLIFAEAVSRLVYCNPFLGERISLEKAALGDEFTESDAAWNLRADLEGYHPNVLKIVEKCEALTKEMRGRLASGKEFREKELDLYEDLVLFLLYHRYSLRLDEAIKRALTARSGAERMDYYSYFAKEAEHLLSIPGVKLPRAYTGPHLFAIFYQIRRAFHHIFNYILGTSAPTIRLRASAWQSVFTHDLKRYSLTLYKNMQEITTLISGPSGTGKELVARAIAHSRYIPFDPENRKFTENFMETFHPINISALSQTLIESELFGHRKGAFTGADQERAGWLEACGPNGSVFLDEIGEIEGHVQVKLLRVLQSGEFSRLGETKVRRFLGKIIAATNRDLAEEMSKGSFREDLYYRLCSDMIRTPSLLEQISESPDELQGLVRHLAKKLVGEDADSLSKEVMDWIDGKLGLDYDWPGNIRELEQCVKNIMIRREYIPAIRRRKGSEEELTQALRGVELTAEELINLYCSVVYSETKSYEETARRLDLDRRTVRKRVAG